VRDVACGRKPRRLPIFACSEEFDVKWHGKYTYEELCQDGAKMAEVWIAAIEEFDYDWAWLQVDDCFEFEPLGVGTHGEGNILRATRDYLPMARQTLETLRMPDPRSDGRMPEKLKALRLVRRHFGEDVLVAGSCAAPYSSVGLLCGLQEPMLAGLTDPELLEAACDFFVQWQARYIEAQMEAGPVRSRLGGARPPSISRSISIAGCSAVVPALVEDPTPAAGVPPQQRISAPLGRSGVSVDIISADPASTWPRCWRMGGAWAVIVAGGNLDRSGAHAARQPKSPRKRRGEDLFDAGGYLFNTGEMNPRDVPPENMKAMIAAARDAAK
jgi:uroporphyrinogen decarboxylase